MDYKINNSTNLDYDSILENVVVFALLLDDKEHFTFVDIKDREEKDGNGNPWYSGAFGNSLIYLLSGRTDAVYLLDEKNIKEKINQALRIHKDKKIIERILKENALHTISRSDDINKPVEGKLTLEDFSPDYRHKIIGGSEYWICRREQKWWYIYEERINEKGYAESSPYENVEEVINLFNSITKEFEIIKEV